MRAWHTYRAKTGRPRAINPTTYWRVKGYAPGAKVRVAIVEANSRLMAMNKAMAEWGFPALTRLGASVTHGCAA